MSCAGGKGDERCVEGKVFRSEVEGGGEVFYRSEGLNSAKTSGVEEGQTGLRGTLPGT